MEKFHINQTVVVMMNTEDDDFIEAKSYHHDFTLAEAHVKAIYTITKQSEIGLTEKVEYDLVIGSDRVERVNSKFVFSDLKSFRSAYIEYFSSIANRKEIELS